MGNFDTKGFKESLIGVKFHKKWILTYFSKNDPWAPRSHSAKFQTNGRLWPLSLPHIQVLAFYNLNHIGHGSPVSVAHQVIESIMHGTRQNNICHYSFVKLTRGQHYRDGLKQDRWYEMCTSCPLDIRLNN